MPSKKLIVMIFYFSGCGNSRFIAESIAQALNEQLVFIPEAERGNRFEYSHAENERVGFVFPIYSWRPPQLVLEFVQKLKFAQKPAYVWMAATCGDNGGVAEKVFGQQLVEIGLTLNADFCFQMQTPTSTWRALAPTSQRWRSVKSRKPKHTCRKSSLQSPSGNQ